MSIPIANSKTINLIEYMKKTLRCLMFAVLTLVSIAANAEDYELKPGINTLKTFVSCNATYTATSDCKVLIEAAEVFNVTYEGVEYTPKYVPGTYSQIYEINDVKEGGKILITNGFVMNSAGIKLTVMEQGKVVPVEIKGVTPEQRKTFPWSGTGMVTVNFNKEVVLKDVSLRVGNTLLPVDDVHIGSSVSFNITNTLNKLLTNGMLNTGDRFTIEITGLCDAADKDNLYNGDGKLILGYFAPYPQHRMSKATVGENQLSYMAENTYQFLSYYAKDAEDGLFVIEFEENIKSVGGVVMTMGNLDLSASGKYHRSELPYTIEGNKLLVDARGTLRTLDVLFPAVVEEEAEEGAESGMGSYDKEHVTITLANVVDVNDNAFLSDLPGSVGTFSFVMGYKEIIDEAYIDGDNVADGDVVNEGQEISLWLSNPDIKFDGLEVKYTESVINESDGVETLTAKSVFVDKFTVEPDGVEGVIITFVMPEMPSVSPGSTIRVSLNNANSSDGMPHSLYISFKAPGTPTAIENVKTGVKANGIYTISGVKVADARMMPGKLYIVNGKKIRK